MLINTDSALSAFQELNARIYLKQNDRSYANENMVSRLHRYVTRILKDVRKERTGGRSIYNLGMAFSWVLALANRFHIDLAIETFKRFPYVCPYCQTAPCSCKSHRQPERSMVATNRVMPDSLREFQKMFGAIYVNTLKDAAMHLAEEAGEFDEAVEHYAGLHSAKLFDNVVTELVDVSTNIFAVANCLDIDLADELVRQFVHGCPECRQIPCQCGFIVQSRV